MGFLTVKGSPPVQVKDLLCFQGIVPIQHGKFASETPFFNLSLVIL